MPNNVRERPEMEIRISGLQDGDYPFSFEVPASDIELPRFDGNVSVQGTLRKVSTQFFITSVVAGELVGECDRCLAEIRRPVNVPMNLYYVVGLDSRSDSPAEVDAEMRSLHQEQDSIVLDDEVRQTLMLEVPLKMLCKEECAGLCSGCGADLNREECRCEEAPIDPRWAKLADVFRKKDES